MPLKSTANSEDADRREVAERIKAALNATGKTRAWVAEEIGISNAAIYAVIGGQGGWPDARAKLCAWLCLDARGFARPGQNPPAPEVPPEPWVGVKFIPATPPPEVEPVATPPAEDNVLTLTPEQEADALLEPAVVPRPEGNPPPNTAPFLHLPEDSDLATAAAAAGRLSAALSKLHATATLIAGARREIADLEAEFAATKRQWEEAHYEWVCAQWPMPATANAV